MTQIKVEVSSLKSYNKSLKDNATEFAKILLEMGKTNSWLSCNWKGVDASVFSIKSDTFLHNAQAFITNINNVTSGNDRYIGEYLDRINTINL